MIISIHQPNFFPWIGYFQKICLSDTFVFLDNVQIQKTGASYTNRVTLNFGGSAHYVTAPLARCQGFEDINQSTFANNLWKSKFIKSLQTYYGKSTFFKEYSSCVFDLINSTTNNISDFNINSIITLSRLFGFEVNFVRSSTLETSADPTQRLIDIVKALKAGSYLSGSGGANYQDENAFRNQGIQLLYCSRPSLQYNQLQTNEFIPGLSILDAIFNIGVDNVKQYFLSVKGDV